MRETKHKSKMLSKSFELLDLLYYSFLFFLVNFKFNKSKILILRVPENENVKVGLCNSFVRSRISLF